MGRTSKKKKVLLNKFALIGEGFTEWYYFNSMRKAGRLCYDIKPELPKHSDLKSINDKAEECLQLGYIKVFCIVDYDTIARDQTEFNKYNKIKQKSKNNIIWIESMPSIEFWFLLHYQENFSSKIYTNYKEIEKDLKKHISDYDKTKEYFIKKDIYSLLEHNGSKATKLSKISCNKKEESDNIFFPYTNMNILYDILFKEEN